MTELLLSAPSGGAVAHDPKGGRRFGHDPRAGGTAPIGRSGSLVVVVVLVVVGLRAGMWAATLVWYGNLMCRRRHLA